MNSNGKYTGNVAAFLAKRQFGFIFSPELDRRVFFHLAAWHRATPPVDGEAVRFDLKPSSIPGQERKAGDVWPTDPPSFKIFVKETRSGVDALNEVVS
jgi:cold shock CspA family protein